MQKPVKGREIPQGYRKIAWAQTVPNMRVYLQTGSGEPAGPHRVVDPTTYTLENVSQGATHTCQKESLLCAVGPRVVTTWANGAFAGLYADVPLEVVAVSMDENADKLFEVQETRSRDLDTLPDDYSRVVARQCGDGWQGFFGSWDIVETRAPDPETHEVEFVIVNKLMISSLILELINNKKAFKVEPTSKPDEVMFTVTQTVYEWMTKYLEDASVERDSQNGALRSL